MKKQMFSLIVASTLIATSAVALAQPTASVATPTVTGTTAVVTATPTNATGPAAPAQAGRYIGPSSTALTTVKQLLESGKDDQYARLQGKIVSHDKEKNYTFADDSGRMTVEISSKRFPEGQAVNAEQRVELSGKLDKGWRTTEFEVKEIRLLP